MKNTFKEYYKLEKKELKTLWDNAVFVFDTNVLLNMYRYQAPTRDALLNVMTKLNNRIWIPYHVGLEFQRNRLAVIAEQHKKYSEVQNVISSSISNMNDELNNLQLEKRHSHINPKNLLEEINKIKNNFIVELEKLEEKSININSDDKIRESIDTLFKGKIGNPPENQIDIDNIFIEGKTRFENAVPPGFKDTSKGKDFSDKFMHSGITYERKYGDLIIWKQIISYAKSGSLKDLIFITDDNKSDWWWKIDSNGTKTIGVRPELTNELFKEAGVKKFNAYSTDNFLTHANEMLDTKVKTEVIEEIKAVTIRRRSNEATQPLSFGLLSNNNAFRSEYETHQAVFIWLKDRFGVVKEKTKGYLNFIAYQDERKYAIEVKRIRNHKEIEHSIEMMMEFSYSEQSAEYDVCELVLVAQDNKILEKTINVMYHIENMNMKNEFAHSRKAQIRIHIGKIENEEINNLIFMPHYATIL